MQGAFLEKLSQLRKCLTKTWIFTQKWTTECIQWIASMHFLPKWMEISRNLRHHIDLAIRSEESIPPDPSMSTFVKFKKMKMIAELICSKPLVWMWIAFKLADDNQENHCLSSNLRDVDHLVQQKQSTQFLSHNRRFLLYTIYKAEKNAKHVIMIIFIFFIN